MLNWDGLKSVCADCTRCGLCETRHNVVFGVGNEDADIMFVGEGPGEQEDLKGQPFVGPAGKLLDDMLCIIDLSRETNCYIANIVKCRPPQNRDPKPEETACCIGYLSRQLEIIKPKIIVCLGRVAATILIDKGFKVTRQHCQQAGIEDGKAQLLFLQKTACQHQHRQYCQRSIKDGGQGASGQKAGLCIKAGDR